MSVLDQLGVDLTSKLEAFLADLRTGDRVSTWLGDPGFLKMYESYETNVRTAFASAVAMYKLQADEAEGEEDDYRNAVVITIKETLIQYLNAYKQIMTTSVNMMMSAFGAAR